MRQIQFFRDLAKEALFFLFQRVRKLLREKEKFLEEILHAVIGVASLST